MVMWMHSVTLRWCYFGADSRTW